MCFYGFHVAGNSPAMANSPAMGTGTPDISPLGLAFGSKLAKRKAKSLDLRPEMRLLEMS